jgi:hypothetical protein
MKGNMEVQKSLTWHVAACQAQFSDSPEKIYDTPSIPILAGPIYTVADLFQFTRGHQ